VKFPFEAMVTEAAISPKRNPFHVPMMFANEAGVAKLYCDVGKAEAVNVVVPAPESTTVPLILVPLTYVTVTDPV
jgi:hypothetical protein